MPYARFNIELVKPATQEAIAELQDILYNAALWAGADDPEVFFVEKTKVVGVSIEIEDSTLSVLEAGAALGQCEAAYENSELDLGPTWFSIHDDQGQALETPYDPTGTES